MSNRYFYDLHIHSALSSCAENDMTPNNIVNMALLKGLDFIAITDHNSAENVKAVMKCAQNKDIIVVPGMELETAEEVHLACLFPDLESVIEYSRKIYSSLPEIKNNERIFGQQLVVDSGDKIIRIVDGLLSTATRLTIDEIVENVRDMGGIAIPAHVDRKSYSVISNLGSIPECLQFSAIELSKENEKSFIFKHPELKDYNIIISSDAHCLGNILERTSSFPAEFKSIENLFGFLRNI